MCWHGQGEERGSGAVDNDHGTSRGRSLQPPTNSYILVRELFIYWNICKFVHSCLVQKVKYISVKYIYPLQVRNKPCDGETEHAFILGSMDCVDVNNNYTNHIPSSFHFSSTTTVHQLHVIHFFDTPQPATQTSAQPYFYLILLSQQREPLSAILFDCPCIVWLSAALNRGRIWLTTEHTVL